MIQLSHIGEVLISKILAASDEAMRVTCGDFVEHAKPFHVEQELRLNKCGSLRFDGVHKVDISILNPNTHTCFPIEAKLGLDRLGKSEFGKRFLTVCGTSHKNTRVKGNMISILERYLPAQCEGQTLSVTFGDNRYALSEKWTLISRQAVIDKWLTSGKPCLSQNCKIVSFEDLVRIYGGKTEFNQLVSDVISMDYYTEWKCGA